MQRSCRHISYLDFNKNTPPIARIDQRATSDLKDAQNIFEYRNPIF